MLKIDIASRLSNEFGDSSTDVDSLNLFRNWIDEVWLDIQSRFPWLNREATYNQTISNGVATLALNTNIKRIKSHLLLCFVALFVIKESERILSSQGYSLIQAIEILGKVGEGEIRVGNVNLPIDSELSNETQALLKLFTGY